MPSHQARAQIPPIYTYQFILCVCTVITAGTGTAAFSKEWMELLMLSKSLLTPSCLKGMVRTHSPIHQQKLWFSNQG